MSFDFKKEYREFYLPKAKPEIVTVPCANYIAVRGRGDPNEENGAYQRAIGVLYAVAYTLKMSKRAGHEIEGFFDYVVPPLEGFWQMPDTETVDYGRKSDFCWISVLRLPDFITKADFDWAVEAAAKKKKLDCSAAEFLTVDEGLCVQIMHVGSFDDEPESVARMDAFLRENGYENDLNDVRLHHEIYLSDPRRVAAEKRKTVIRHPIKKDRLLPKREAPKYIGAICETAGQFAYIYAIADTSHLAMSAPIISSYCAASVLWSRLFLKEKLSWKHYAMILLVVIGIAVMGVFDI